MQRRQETTDRKREYGLLFPLGRIVATPGALAALEESGEIPQKFLKRHVRGDWGDLPQEDQRDNDRAVNDGTRILSAYETSVGTRIWIISEADRSVTTLLLPSDY